MDEDNIPQQTAQSESTGADLMSAFDTAPVEGEQGGIQGEVQQEQPSLEEQLERARGFQSRYDKTLNEFNQYKQMASTWEKAYNLLV